MNSKTSFQSFIHYLLTEELPRLEITELEMLGTQTAFYVIFEQEESLETIYSELLDYCEDDEELFPLIPKIEDYYQTINV